MYNKIITLIITLVLLQSCNSGNPMANKQKELEGLKKQYADLSKQIKDLEVDIAKNDTSKKANKIIEVGTMAIAPDYFSTYIEVQGKVDADQNVSISSRIPGTLTTLNAVVGQEVRKGQILGETDANAIQLQLATLQTSLDLAKSVYQKQQNLWTQNIGSEIQLLQAKTNKESLENNMKTIREQVSMTKIIAPISGRIDAVNVKVGQSVAPGMPAINIINFNSLKVKADVAEAYSNKVKRGNRVQVFFPDLEDSITSTINFTALAINPMSRTFAVEIPLSNTKNYHPNMVARVKINDFKSAKPVITIPVNYIQKDMNEMYVLVAENGVAVKKTIVKGREYNGICEIATGLVKGDKLITEGYDLINEGDKIKENK
jgi:membrane fusion protein, multidrug efflux system